MFNFTKLRPFCLTILLFAVLLVSVWGYEGRNGGYGSKNMGHFANRRTMGYPQISNGVNPCIRTKTRCTYRNRRNQPENQQQAQGYFQQQPKPYYQVPTTRIRPQSKPPPLQNEQLHPMKMLVSSISKQAPYIPLEPTASQNHVFPSSNQPDCYQNQQKQPQEQGWASPQVPPSPQWFQQPNQPRSNQFSGNTQQYKHPQSMMPQVPHGSYGNKEHYQMNQEWPEMDGSKYPSGQQTHQQPEQYTSVAQNQQGSLGYQDHQTQPCLAEAPQHQKPIHGQWPQQSQQSQQPAQYPCIATNQPHPPEQGYQQQQYDPPNSQNSEYSQPQQYPPSHVQPQQHQQQPFYHGPSGKSGSWKTPQQQSYPQETGNSQWGPLDAQIREIELPPNLGPGLTVVMK